MRCHCWRKLNREYTQMYYFCNFLWFYNYFKIRCLRNSPTISIKCNYFFISPTCLSVAQADGCLPFEFNKLWIFAEWVLLKRSISGLRAINPWPLKCIVIQWFVAIIYKNIFVIIICTDAMRLGIISINSKQKREVAILNQLSTS